MLLILLYTILHDAPGSVIGLGALSALASFVALAKALWDWYHEAKEKRNPLQGLSLSDSYVFNIRHVKGLTLRQLFLHKDSEGQTPFPSYEVMDYLSSTGFFYHQDLEIQVDEPIVFPVSCSGGVITMEVIDE